MFHATSTGRAPTATAPSLRRGAGRSEVGRKAVKRVFSHLGQGSLGGTDRAVEEDRNVEILADPLGACRRGAGALDAGVLGVQRDEGYDVDDPESRVHALVGSQIERAEGAGDERAHVSKQGLGDVDEGEDRTIV